MSDEMNNTLPENTHVRIEHTFKRFTLGQRWEHWVLFFSCFVLLLTGLPQKYRTTTWSQSILSTPERVEAIQTIHHIIAIVLAILVIFHMIRNLYLLFRRKLTADMFPTLQDVRDTWQMLKYLLFIQKEKPLFGKYNFEQKVTYWFLFFGIGILGISGLIIWFPEVVAKVIPGGIIPAAKLAHSTEAIVITIFVIIWHFYHVHLERLNLSIFTGWLNAEDMKTYHTLEFRRLTGQTSENLEPGENDQ
jgi:formate dehydrogenase gamma subunit